MVFCGRFDKKYGLTDIGPWIRKEGSGSEDRVLLLAQVGPLDYLAVSKLFHVPL
jgi:hypothetical protein